MPTLQTKFFRMIHIPKTGGWWRQRVLDWLRMDYELADDPHAGHEWGNQELPAIAFVREPVEWYKSAYRFHAGRDWALMPEMRGATWAEWLDNQLRTAPYHEIIEQAIGQPPMIEHLFQFRTMKQDFAFALRTLTGLDFARVSQAINNTPPQNVSPKLTIELTSEQRRRILLIDWQAEVMAC